MTGIINTMLVETPTVLIFLYKHRKLIDGVFHLICK
jgi:hypothetical protein